MRVAIHCAVRFPKFPSIFFYISKNIVKKKKLQGACVIYSADALRTRMHLTYIIIRAISLTTDIYVVRNSKEIILFDEKDTSQRQERLEMKSI